MRDVPGHVSYADGKGSALPPLAGQSRRFRGRAVHRRGHRANSLCDDKKRLEIDVDRPPLPVVLTGAASGQPSPRADCWCTSW